MKAVIISVILLVTVVLGTWLNSLWVCDRIEQMLTITEKIYNGAENRQQNAEQLYLLWESSSDILSLSASLREIDRATEHIITLCEACRSENEWAITQSCLLLRAALEDITRYEKCVYWTVL